jgi:hypothetical protein
VLRWFGIGDGVSSKLLETGTRLVPLRSPGCVKSMSLASRRWRRCALEEDYRRRERNPQTNDEPGRKWPLRLSRCSCARIAARPAHQRGYRSILCHTWLPVPVTVRTRMAMFELQLHDRSSIAMSDRYGQQLDRTLGAARALVLANDEVEASTDFIRKFDGCDDSTSTCSR